MDAALLKKIALIFAATLGSIFFQASVLHYLSPALIIPNFVFLIAVALSLYEVTPLGAVLVFLVGLLFDLCTGVLVGPSAGAFVFIFGILAVLSSRMFVDSWFPLMVTVFVASLVSNLVYGLLVYQFAPVISRSFSAVFVEALFSSLLAPAVIPLIRGIIVKNERATSGKVTRRRSRTKNSP